MYITCSVKCSFKQLFLSKCLICHIYLVLLVFGIDYIPASYVIHRPLVDHSVFEKNELLISTHFFLG